MSWFNFPCSTSLVSFSHCVSEQMWNHILFQEPKNLKYKYYGIHTRRRSNYFRLGIFYLLQVLGEASSPMTLFAIMKGHNFFWISNKRSIKFGLCFWSTGLSMMYLPFPFGFGRGLSLLSFALLDSHDRSTCRTVGMILLHSCLNYFATDCEVQSMWYLYRSNDRLMWTIHNY